jgi:hypothetical protein
MKKDTGIESYCKVHGMIFFSSENKIYVSSQEKKSLRITFLSKKTSKFKTEEII